MTAEWRKVVEALLVKKYRITIVDIGLSDDEVQAFADYYPQPDEFVDWFARKSDLIGGREIGLRSLK